MAEHAHRFYDLHAGPRPLLLVNVWDGMSARAAVAGGAPALGTTSFGVAAGHGLADSELLPLEGVMTMARAVVDAVDVPVTLDLEKGHGDTPAGVAGTVRAALECGVVGCNIEDGHPGGPERLRPAAEQAERLTAARQAADAAGVPLFINARCDLWFGSTVEDAARADEAVARAQRYREAGADGLFLPGLLDLGVLRTVCDAVDLPVNVMAGPGMPSLDDLAAAGVRRVSQGANTFLSVLGTIAGLTRRYLAGELDPASDAFAAGLGTLPSLLHS